MQVLLVEDETGEALAVARWLKGAWSASVVVAANGDAAMRELDARQFDVIIADEGLPDVSGMEVLAAARLKQPHAYRAVLTGTFNPELVHRAGLSDALFMNKPAQPRAFDEMMMRAARRRARRFALSEHVARRAAEWALSNVHLRFVRSHRDNDGLVELHVDVRLRLARSRPNYHLSGRVDAAIRVRRS
jgi:DNA-binding NtrC family response regulator